MCHVFKMIKIQYSFGWQAVNWVKPPNSLCTWRLGSRFQCAAASQAATRCVPAGKAAGWKTAPRCPAPTPPRPALWEDKGKVRLAISERLAISLYDFEVKFIRIVPPGHFFSWPWIFSEKNEHVIVNREQSCDDYTIIILVKRREAFVLFGFKEKTTKAWGKLSPLARLKESPSKTLH